MDSYLAHINQSPTNQLNMGQQLHNELLICRYQGQNLVSMFHSQATSRVQKSREFWKIREIMSLPVVYDRYVIGRISLNRLISQ